MQFLLVEDDDPKRERITSFLAATYEGCLIEVARSVKTAIAKIKSVTPDIMLLDMSLSTFDIGGNESGGRPQSFGGIDVLSRMHILNIDTPVIFVTQYEVFSRDGAELNHNDLRRELAQRFPCQFRGLVHYNSMYDDWKDELSKLIEESKRRDS